MNRASSCAVLIALLSVRAAARPAELQAIQEDFALLSAQAGLPDGSLAVRREAAGPGPDRAVVSCEQRAVVVSVRASDAEWAPTAYRALQTLGFLFPHPRRTVAPTLAAMRRHCGETVVWRPRMRKRGFHLHTQHPSEWTEGFLGGHPRIAEDAVRWLARNRQNLVQVVALKTAPDLEASLTPPFALARRLGLETGLSVSFASIQQKSLRLVGVPAPLLPLAGLFPRWCARRAALRAGALADAIPFDFLSAELGTSEFTPTGAGAALSAIEAVRAALAERGRALFIKVHVSSNQDALGENYNFLARRADPRVGVLVHTVMPYGLEGPAPVYGRRDFADLAAFLLDQKKARPAWYFPETSYFIGIDIDAPLLLTDYLAARSDDLDRLERSKVEGVLTFSTGQELGYWLMDWTTALDAGDARSPYSALDLLGERRAVWKPIVSFQTRHLKDAGVLGVVSFSNLMDELPFVARRHRVLDRNLLRELETDHPALGRELAALEAAAAEVPPIAGVKNEELRLMLEATFARLRHALAVRRAIAARSAAGRAARLDEAAAIRREALARVSAVAARHSRYPEARVFERGANLTSYAYGYGFPARTLWYWEREEEIVRGRRTNPFFRSLYELSRILL